MVDDGVMARIVSTPFVDVVAYTRGGTQLQGADAQDARATATIQDALALQVCIQQGGSNHASRLVGARAEREMSVNLNCK